MELKQLEKIAKALGDINRLKILQDMAANSGSIQCAKILKVLNLAQPSISHHIKSLIDAGLIEPEKDGRSYSYLINKSLLKEYVKHIASFATKSKL